MTAAPTGLTYAQAAAALGKHVTTLRRWAAAGKFPVRKLAAGTVLIDPADLWAFWEASKQVGGQPPPPPQKRRKHPTGRRPLSNRIIQEVQL